MRITATLTGALVAGAAALAVAAAPTAAATPTQDATFLSLISSHGLSFKSSDVAIAEGKAVCDVLDDGYSLVSTVAAVENLMPVGHDGALTVVAAAIVSYCPWHSSGTSSAPTRSPVV